MKKIIIVLVSGVFFTALLTGHATAQKVTGFAFAAPKIVYETDSTGSGNSSLRGENEAANNKSVKKKDAEYKATKLNFKVTTHFNKTFKNVSDIRWDFSNDMSIVHFKTDGKKGKTVYDKNGNWVYTIITYEEDQMPADMKSMIEENYDGFTITSMQEIKQQNETCHMVYLDSQRSFKHVLVYKGEIINEETFHKVF